MTVGPARLAVIEPADRRKDGVWESELHFLKFDFAGNDLLQDFNPHSTPAVISGDTIRLATDLADDEWQRFKVGCGTNPHLPDEVRRIKTRIAPNEFRLDGPLTTSSSTTVHFYSDVKLPLNRCFFTPLTGSPIAMDVALAMPHVAHRNLNRGLAGRDPYPLPVELRLRLDGQQVSLYAWLNLSLETVSNKMRLMENRIYFYFPHTEDASNLQFLDLGIFTVCWSGRQKLNRPASPTDHDGYFDLDERELILKFTDPEGSPGKVDILFPGGVSNAAELKEGKRFVLPLQKFAPSKWPAKGAASEEIYLRLRETGLSFFATVDQKSATVLAGGDGTARIAPIKLAPAESANGVKSEIAVIDNDVRAAMVNASTSLPGLKGVQLQVTVGLRKAAGNRCPEVVCTLKLEKEGDAPVGELEVGFLSMKLNALKLSLAWSMQSHEWSITALANGEISIRSSVDLTSLGQIGTIQFVDLDLVNLGFKELRLPLKLSEPLRLSILDGAFGVELDDLALRWSFDNGVKRAKLTAITCGIARFEFKSSGPFDVKVGAGGLEIPFEGKPRLQLPSRLSFAAKLSDSVKLRGDVGWVERMSKENVEERFLFAAGDLEIKGLPPVKGLVKLGSGTKRGGPRALQVVLYGAMQLDTTVYSGVVVKELGAGIGINNRLAGITPRPRPDDLIQRIDQLTPGDADSWSFVQDDGTYISIVASVILANLAGPRTVVNAYVLQLIASLDTNLDAIAAGKLWIGTSVAKALENPNRPALVGALALSPQTRTIAGAFESRPDPFIENNPLLAEILKNGRVRYSFRFSPDLVDHHLERISYGTNLLGLDVQVTGSLRLAIFRQAVLLRAQLAATAHIDRTFEMGPGGATVQGNLRLAYSYGGILSGSEAVAYATVAAGATFQVTAWLEVGFSKSIKVFRKRITISWSITFHFRSPRVEIQLRGGIAFQDRQMGLEAAVGIEVSVGGYPLRLGGHIGFNEGLVQRARQRVAAFERDLDAILGARSFLALPAPVARPPARAWTAANETWVHHSRPDPDKRVTFHMLVPRASGEWVCPRHVTLAAGGTDVEVRGDRIRITTIAHGLKDAQQPYVGLIGDWDDEAKAAPRRVHVSDDDHFDLIFGSGHDLGWTKQARSWFARYPKTVDRASVSGTTLTIKTADHGLRAGTRVRIALARPRTLETVDERDADVRDGDTLTISSMTDAGQVQQELTGWFVVVDALAPQFIDDVERVRVLGPSLTTVRRLDAATSTVEFRSAVIATGSARFVFFEDTQKKCAAPPSGTGFRWPAGPVSRVTVDPETVTALSAGSWEVREVLRELVMPWNREAPGLIPNPENIPWLAQTMQAVQESSRTAADPGEAGTPDLGGCAVVSDPRVESLARQYWLAGDAFRPDYAPPATFRPAEDVELGEVGSSELAELQRYLVALEALRQTRVHAGLDLTEPEERDRSRATLVQMMLDDLTAGPGPTRFLESAGDLQRVGTIVELPASIPTSKLRFAVKRTGEKKFRAVASEAPSEVDSDHVVTATPRQQFSTEGGGVERLTVHLPVRLNEALVRRSAESIGHCQIYRSIAGEPPVMIADEVRPQLALIRDATALATGTAIRSSDTEVMLEPDLLARDLAGYYLRFHDDGSTIRITSNDRRTANLENTFVRQTAKYTLESGGTVVLAPYLFTDSFELRDGKLTDPELVRRGVQLDVTPIAYWVRFVPPGEARTPDSVVNQLLPIGGAIQLHNPKVSRPPRDLSIAFAGEELLCDRRTDATLRLQLLESLDGRLVPSTERLIAGLTGGDLELWAQEKPFDQAGFFGSEDANSRSDAPAAGGASLAAIREPALESTHGKFRVPLAPQDPAHPGRYQPTESARKLMRPGFEYRFFVRRAVFATQPLLAPLPVVLVREWPALWSKDVATRNVDHLELVDRKSKLELQAAQPRLLAEDAFAVDDLATAAGLNALRVHWYSRSLLDGGVEVIVQDRDEPTRIWRQLVEVIEEDNFKKSQRQFAESADWQLAERDARDRVNCRPVPVAAMPSPPNDAELARHFLWLRGEEDLPGAIVEAGQELVLALVSTAGWPKVYHAARALAVHLYRFRRSKHSLGIPKIETGLDAALAQIRTLMIGCAAERLAELSRELDRISKLHIDSTADMPPAVVADLLLARSLSGIMRRRIAIAEDLVSLQELKSIPDYVATRELWPRQEAWGQQRTEYSDLVGTSSPHSGWLLTNVGNPAFVGQMADWFREEFVGGYAGSGRLIGLIQASEPDMARCSPRAAGLAELLASLRVALGKTDHLLERPHHELLSGPRADEPPEKEPRLRPISTPLLSILPDEARAQSQAALPRPSFTATGGWAARMASAGIDGSTIVVEISTRLKDADGTEGAPVQQRVSVTGGLKSLDLAAAGTDCRLVVGHTDRSSSAYSVFDALRAEHMRTVDDRVHARFVRTPQGLRVLSAYPAAAPVTVVLEECDDKSTQKLAEFTQVGSPSVLSAVAHDAYGPFAGTQAGQVLAWRLAGGAPEAAFQLGSRPITAVASVVMPTGRWIAAASGETVRFFHAPGQERELGIQLDDLTFSEPVTSIAFDPLHLRLAAGLSSGTVEVWDIGKHQQLPTPAAGNSTPVTSLAFVPGDRPWLTMCHANKKRVAWALHEDGSWKVVSLGLTPGLLCAASVMPSVRSSDSRSVISYVNFLERMGFAIDLAVVQQGNILASQQDLLEKIDQVLKAMPSDFQNDHEAFVILGREHDASYRSAEAIGFSFLKLIVIPRDFGKLLRGVPDGPPKVNDAIRAVDTWLNFRSIATSIVTANLDEQDAVAHLRYLVELARYLGEALPGMLARVDVEPRSDGWLTVPARAGRSHCVWEVPDRRGRCLRVAVRSVSRHEGLLRWMTGMREPMPIPVETALSTDQLPDQTGGNAFTLIVPIETSNRVAGSLPATVEVRIKGQRQLREILRVEPRKIFTAEDDPWLEPPSERDWFEVRKEHAGWATVDLAPIVDARLHEGPRPLTVYTFPHPSLIQFSYQIAPEGSRSLSNQISLVRTGFRGTELTFRYDVAERQARRMSDVLRDVIAGDQAMSRRERVIWSLPPAPPVEHRLFPGERLITLPDLPYFYEYRLDARSTGDVRRVNPLEPAPGDLVGTATSSAAARRGPGQLCVLRPTIEKGTAADSYIVTLYLSTFGEHVVERELARAPTSLTRKVLDQDVRVADLPDLAMEYGIYHLAPGGGGFEDYFALLSVTLPWCETHQGGQRPHVKPMSPDVTGVTADPRIRQDVPGQYRVLIQFTRPGSTPGEFRLQALRDGIALPAISFEEVV